MKLLSPIILLSLGATLVIAQQKPQIDQTTRNLTGNPANAVPSSNSGSGQNIGASDTGAQRPVFLKTEHISAFAGFDTKILYRSNPLTLSGDMKQSKTGIWQNGFSGGASLSPIDTDSAVITPIAGGSWTMSDYLNKNLSTLNDYATSAYALLMIQHESGIGYRGGVSYATVRNNDTDSEDYSEFYPNVGLMKTYSINADTIAILDISGGIHYTKSDSLTSSNTQSLNNWDAALSYSLRHTTFLDIVVTPSYRIAYKKFNEGGTINNGRKDVTNTLSIRADYPLAENLNLSANTSYTRRNSSVSTDYKSLDAGFVLGINVRF